MNQNLMNFFNLISTIKHYTNLVLLRMSLIVENTSIYFTPQSETGFGKTYFLSNQIKVLATAHYEIKSSMKSTEATTMAEGKLLIQ